MILWVFWFVLAGWIPAVQAANVASENVADSPSWRMAYVPTNATAGLGSWVWAEQTLDKQTCRLWRSFDIPAHAKVKRAQIKMTVDNGYRLALDGRELGQGAEWRALTEYDITQLLPPGRHVLAVNAFNEFFQAGLIFNLKIELTDGRLIEIKSDENWWVVPDSQPNWETMTEPGSGWQKAKIIAALGEKPWNGYWPLDFVSVPPFRPVLNPFWRTGWFHICLFLFYGIALLICFGLMFQLALKSKEQNALHLERARIARDIHDDFGTRLTKIILEGEVAQNEFAADAQVCRRFERVNDGLRDVLGAMDEVLWAVNPRRDTVRDFVVYICEYAQTFLHGTAINCFLEVEPDMPSLEFELPLRRSLLLAVKEAISNVAKHSAASKLILHIHRTEPGLMVMVEDDGKGFDPAQVSRERNGVANMIQRMSEAGGTCRIISTPGKGCRVKFSISLTRHDSGLGGMARSLKRRLNRKKPAPNAEAGSFAPAAQAPLEK